MLRHDCSKDLVENCTRLGNLVKITVLLVKLTGGVNNEDLKQFNEALSQTEFMSESQVRQTYYDKICHSNVNIQC